MQEEIVVKIDNELIAEQLLFADRENYSKEEQELMLEVIEKRLREDQNYCYYGYGYFNKLVNVCDKVKLTMEEHGMILLAAEGDKIASDAYNAKEAVLDYVSFLCNEKYGASVRNGFNYQKMIKYNIWPASKIARVNRAYFDFLQDDIDFIVTNNLFFERYPEFLDDNYVESLAVIPHKRKILLPKEEKKELKKAIKILENNINCYKEQKGLTVKKKTLFQKIIKK